ncbi:2-dehydro-3-deoxy-6-phosphogalactonate aldolase [Providencia burhodogranariea]|uniref:2-dehydro-3-deoxy-6-phosphogalactonate aldolase n=1 Tax=Providencia burhodogranariea DSM 19968 TaxID=1141662 RepID=K8WEZ5_9GAMM|nr:2-dehydro-3-deoxy-6-phosphogalactonate aldolase [Providencia burhodogranariea]EKT56037.1 2-dehydro-3-deoxy-6-phosphogalactonate aldolase [Providencia burhodogranariea DSM 19968]
MNFIPKIPLIAILRGITPKEVLAHAQVLVDTGFEMIEVPTNSPNWLESIQLLQKEWGDRILIGAGTVTQQAYLDSLINCGGKLMVTPNTNPDLIRQAKLAGLQTYIGAFTPSEIYQAIDAGADVIKIFPCVGIDIAYIKAVRAIVPKQQAIYAVGGVTTQNLYQFIEMGCQGAGLGSDLYCAGQSVEATKKAAEDFVRAWYEIN